VLLQEISHEEIDSLLEFSGQEQMPRHGGMKISAVPLSSRVGPLQIDKTIVLANLQPSAHPEDRRRIVSHETSPRCLSPDSGSRGGHENNVLDPSCDNRLCNIEDAALIDIGRNRWLASCATTRWP
jgi:hypothetical protein